MAQLTRNKARQTTFPTTGYTTQVYAAEGRYYKGMYLQAPSGGGDVSPADDSDAQFAGICQSDVEITAAMVAAGTNLVDVLQSIVFWHKGASALAVKANQYQMVDCSDSDTIVLSRSGKTRVGKIVGIDTAKGELIIDAIATSSIPGS